MPRLLLALALVVLGGCTPALRNGVYGCADENCPPGYRCHDSDHLCYTTPEVVGTDSGMPSDGGGMGMCTTACTPPQTCVVGAWSMPTPGYGCAEETQVNLTNHGAACMMGDSTCTAPDACVVSSGTSHCMRPCTHPGDACAFEEDCIATIGSSRFVCARRCTDDMCTGPFGLTCLGTPSHVNYCLPMGW